jgi:hypothetical protein
LHNKILKFWENVWIFVKFLNFFIDITLSLFGSLYMTSNMYFQQLCIIQNTWMICVLVKILSWVPWQLVWKVSIASIGKVWIELSWYYMLLLCLTHASRWRLWCLGWKRCNGNGWSDNIDANVRHLMNRLIKQYNKFNGELVEHLMWPKEV